MQPYLLDWANLLIRWLHLIAGVAWIGASFYFVMLDSSLRKPAKSSDSERGVSGELWAVHGGGVYHSQKYLLGPAGEPLSEHLHWSKWEAYTTWLSGMGLMVIVYWIGARTYLIDQQVMALTVFQAIAISTGFLVAGWIIYNGLCRLLSGRETLLAGIIFILIVFTSWLLFQIFSARAAYLHVGAVMGTIMVANVFFKIIPGQKKLVSEIRAGIEPDPTPGMVGKQRSVHNTYFTLPVLFIMISHHYPMTYSHEQGWLVLTVIMLAGVLIRQFFVLRHRGRVLWLLPCAGIILLLSMVWYLSPVSVHDQANAVTDKAMQQVVEKRCVACHALSPTRAGFAAPPAGLVLDTMEQIQLNAERIARTVQSHYMPIGNLTGMTDQERDLVASWYAQYQSR